MSLEQTCVVATKRNPDFSIVIPVYFNEGSLFTTMDALASLVLERSDGLVGEVIFVDDGSKDQSLDELLAIQSRFPYLIRVIKFTRNFGQVSAVRAGLAHSSGRCAIVISADGQDPPELINEMLHGHFTEGKEVVICARQDREESQFRKATSNIFYGLMRRLSFPSMPNGGFDFFLLGRRALDEMLSNDEAHPFVQGQILWTGFEAKVIGYTRRERKVGKSRWTFGKKLTYLLDGVLSYSFAPIRLVVLLGVLIALLGFGYAGVVLVSWLVHGNPVQGWTPLVIIVLVLGGVQLLTLGLIGEYLWRTLAQVRNRKPYVIDRTYDQGHVG
jgi:dolichol-phosphate mannosyltransferase